MNPVIKSAGLRVGRVATCATTLLLTVLVFVAGPRVSGQNSPAPELQTAEQIRQLTPEQAARHYPVRLRGVLTFFDQSQFYRFIQDSTEGIYFYLNDSSNYPPLATGQLVEIEGETNPGEYAPIIVPHRITVLGQGTFPQARPISYEDLASGEEDSQFVEIHGIVRAVSFDAQTKYYSIEIATGGGRLTALATQLPVGQSDDLVDSTVKIRGVCVSRFNLQRQLFDLRLLVPHPSDVVIEVPAPSNPFDVPTRSIEQLLRFTPRGPYGHRVKVTGTVFYRRDNDTLYMQDKTEGLYVETIQAGPLLVGDLVEVLGFPAKGEYTPMLQDAIFRKIGSGPLPVPASVTADEALNGTHDCQLVRIEGTVLDRTRYGRDHFLVLQSGGFIFNAYLERKDKGVNFAYLQNGCTVAVTGVCVIERGNDWHAGPDWRAKSFHILLRSAGDIFVLKQPPWWNLQKMLWAVGILGLVVLTALAWVGVLRRRVQKQTNIIRQQLQTEAALKERYEDLFENANDMVFTHDLSGRITSINKTGEQLLGHREEILTKNLLEFVVEEQRAAAAQWLDQVAKGVELPAAEWDFIDASGQRIRLEISARLVGKTGRHAEVESVARDITERKRLEREISEISNREQRRIGHDLHDGVCQQLAAIGYRMDILAEQLQKKDFAEAPEAEKIGSLVNDAINQTRSVARGLFPVRLEEDGLVSALEELATNAGDLFKIRCQLSCEEPFAKVENSVSLHLYYIAQEAVLNAAKHGKATNVDLSLTNANGRFVLAIRDNGTGFNLPDRSSSGMGIRIMRYRARVIGATLDLKCQPGQGTQITCALYSTV